MKGGFSLSVTMFAILLALPTENARADIAKGKEVYNGIGACASCHGAEGNGDGIAAAALNPKPRSFVQGNYSLDTDKDGKAGTLADVTNVISNGAAAYGGSPLMVGRADIPEADRKSLAEYILSLKK